MTGEPTGNTFGGGIVAHGEYPSLSRGWHTGRPKATHLCPRWEEALVRHIRLGDHEKVAEQMDIKPQTVKCYLWQAQDAFNCDTLDACVDDYLRQKGGRLPGFGDQLAMSDE